MKVVIPGGTGQVGTALGRALRSDGHEVVVLTRQPAGEGQVSWDGERLGAMSTATIYAHTHGTANDDVTGVIGGSEKGVPGYWAFSVDIARACERELDEAELPATRKVALRAAMVMTPDRGGVFDVLSRMTRLGLGGQVAGGGQYVSWIHEDDFTAAVRFIIDQDVLAVPVNLAAPGPVRQRDLMRELRAAWGVPVGASGHPVDGGAGRTRHPHRHRAPAQEPASRPRPADHGRIRVPARHLAGGRP